MCVGQVKVSEEKRRELGEEIRSSVVSEHGVDVHHLVSPATMHVLAVFSCSRVRYQLYHFPYAYVSDVRSFVQADKLQKRSNLVAVSRFSWSVLGVNPNDPD